MGFAYACRVVVRNQEAIVWETGCRTYRCGSAAASRIPDLLVTDEPGH
jgi:hypothetical protein